MMAMRIAIAMGRVLSVSLGLTTEIPSAAETTETAGVIIPSAIWEEEGGGKRETPDFPVSLHNAKKKHQHLIKVAHCKTGTKESPSTKDWLDPWMIQQCLSTISSW